MNIYKLIYHISKKKIQFFAIILLAGFLGINVNKLIETKYFFKAKVRFSVDLGNNPEENLNQTISSLENGYINQLHFKNNYIITSKNKNLYEFKIYLKKNDTIEQEKELQELLKITNKYRKNFFDYLLFLKKNRQEELKAFEENASIIKDVYLTTQRINKIKQHLTIIENATELNSETYPIQISIEKNISEDKIKINKYAMAILLIILSMVMYATFIIINEDYKKEIKKFK